MKKLGFGFMRLPLLPGGDPTRIDTDQVNKMVDIFMENGFTYFDTGYPYHGGASEKALCECVVKRYPRTSFTIADKLPTFAAVPPEKYESIFSEQLERLGTDYIDYYLLHNPRGGKPYDVAEEGHAFEFIAGKKAEGKVKHIGMSLHDSPEFLDAVLTKHPEIEFVQLQLNYIDWNSQGIRTRECCEVCRKHGKPVIAMEPVKGGTLTDLPDEAANILKAADSSASFASWAIRFAAGQQDVMMVLSGMSDLSQVRDNVSYMKDFKPLTEEETDAVLRVTDIINRSITIPCTACSYCTKDCPKQIPIPRYFALYNAEMQDSKRAWKSQGDYYNSIASRSSRASECIKCGKCESLCPQHIKIREWLIKVANTFESRPF
jgi:predicted aldo/keto reductase-like oxidoreductase